MGLSTKDVKKLAKASSLSHSDDPKDQDRARARQTEVDYKDLVRQLKAKRKKNMKESFTIDKSAHNKAKRKAKLRNLAKGNANPAEKEAAEKKAGGPKLMGEELTFEGWKEKAVAAVRRVTKKKEKPHKYPEGGGPYVDAGAEAADRVRKKEQRKVGILPDQKGTARKDDR